MKHAQNYPTSCGASALLCAAAELGVKYMPNIDGRNRGQPLKVGDTCEANLFHFLCRAEAKKIRDLDKAGYSMPHEMAVAADAMGLKVSFYMSGLFSGVVSAFYPGAEAKCRNAGFPIIASRPPKLAENQRALKIFIWGLGLHYVLRRPDGSYMDPSDGKDYTNFKALRHWPRLFKDSGITLVLEKPDASKEPRWSLLTSVLY